MLSREDWKGPTEDIAPNFFKASRRRSSSETSGTIIFLSVLIAQNSVQSVAVYLLLPLLCFSVFLSFLRDRPICDKSHFQAIKTIFALINGS